MMRNLVSLLIPAAGESVRMRALSSNVRKPFLPLAGRPMLLRALEPFRGVRAIKETIIAAHPEDVAWIRRRMWHRLRRLGVTDIVEGGARRQDSVQNALRASNPRFGFAAVHDAARPLVSEKEIRAVLQAAFKSGAAILAVPVTDTLKKVAGAEGSGTGVPPVKNHGQDAHATPLRKAKLLKRHGGQAGNVVIRETLRREGLWLAQTPQVVAKEILQSGLACAHAGGIVLSDDAQAAELLGVKVRIVPGSRRNFKITTPEDFKLAEALFVGS